MYEIYLPVSRGRKPKSPRGEEEGEGYLLQWPIQGGFARKGHLFRLQVCKTVGNSIVEGYERVGKGLEKAHKG